MKHKLIIAGGGTGGHIWPGVAVAEQWQRLWNDEAEVLFVGAKGGLEETLVPKAGFRLELLQIGALKRVGIVRKLLTFIQLPLSFLSSVRILLKERPELVIGVGGYASGPFLLAAALLSGFMEIRTGILEFNAVPGFTNRILGKFVERVFLAFEFETAFRKNKVHVTGTPVRSQMSPMPPARMQPFTVFIFGGSQGAMGINTLVIQALEHLGERLPQIQFIHQTGQKDYERVLAAHQKAGTRHRVEKFIHEMQPAYAESSVLVCRAGASTLSEIAAVRRAAILIPLPTAADNHQLKNAELFERKGAARVLRQNETDGKALAQLIVDLMEHPEQIREMEAHVAGFHRPGAAESVIKLLAEFDPQPGSA